MTVLSDKYNRQVNYLRVSVTDRCNLNCMYCRPANVPGGLSHYDFLSYEEVLRIITIGSRLGITKVRITGGEPLVRKDIGFFLEQLGDVEGLKDISLTTNGVLLADHLAVIQKAGITRLNISLDTLDPEKYEKITGRDAFARVWNSIIKALEAGFSPVKLNMVAMRGVNDDEFLDFAGLSKDRPLHVRFIEHMPIGDQAVDANREILSQEIKDCISESEELTSLGPIDDTTAERFSLKGAAGEVGFISPISKHFCTTCNRLRLTADGRLLSCLLSNRFCDIKDPLRSGASNEDLADIIRQAVWNKPGFSGDAPRRDGALPREMSAIGG